MMHAHWSMLLAAVIPSLLAAQSAGQPVPLASRKASLTVGAGNATGWAGVQGERYFGRGRRSIFLGLGYTPARNAADPTGPAVAAGARAYSVGERHRAFGEASLSMLRRVQLVPGIAKGRRLYGPGLQGGYQYLAPSGFTIMASIGLGYALRAPEGVTQVTPMGGVSLGYTWR